MEKCHQGSYTWNHLVPYDHLCTLTKSKMLDCFMLRITNTKSKFRFELNVLMLRPLYMECLESIYPVAGSCPPNKLVYQKNPHSTD